MGTGWDDEDEECSVIGDKGEIGFIDYGDDKSVCDYNPMEEGPVIVSVPFPFVSGKPRSVLIGQTATDSITINNTTSEPIDLWNVKIFCSNPEDSYTLSLMEPPSAEASAEDIQGFMESFTLEDRVLQPRKTLTVWLSCKPKDLGLHTTVVHFDIGDENDRIERVVFLLAEDVISQSLTVQKSYQRPQRKNRVVMNDDYVKGSRPTKATSKSYTRILPRYTIPKDIKESLQTKQIPESIVDGLSRENYGPFFSTLLIMEELQHEEEMKGHDMEDATMQRRGHLLALEVPGLAEKRPSLVIGDYVLAKPSIGDDAIAPYQGYIHRVEADKVCLKFDRALHLLHQDGAVYSIRFTCNRTNERRQYQAVQNAVKLDNEFLFPSQAPRRSIQESHVVPINPCLNMEQMTSVEKILGCEGGPPYVIHGPPGTGKTLTLVEAMLQLYKNRKNSRILVCASSNSAADHILENLISKDLVEVRVSEIFRLNASSRLYEDVHPEHKAFCYLEENVFACPPDKALKRYRIIISTYMSASLLYAEGVKKGHFSHILLDEAGQASEPETMVPIANLCRSNTVVVLAGDPMQLGPVIYCKDAETYGLGKSYLERLFECEFYRNEDENYVTKLVRNYRCHPAILELPSELFYKKDLIADKEETKSSLDAWGNLLPNKEFPVLFIGIQGCDEREGNNPSWFNRIEISKVVEIIRKLKRTTDLEDSDIGVITPYRQQVTKLKKTLEDKLDMPDVKVGSVEQFQGQERQVIIISTVRSTVKHNEFDRLHYLGFLSNPRRFNVAITRARSLLIIIGNPHIISKDPYWDRLLRYCADNNSYQGCPLPERQEFSEEDFAVGQKLYYEPDNFQANNNTEWDVQENFVPGNNGEWGNEHVNFRPSTDAGWEDGNQKFQRSNSEWGEENQNFQPSSGGWGDENQNYQSRSGGWGNENQNYQPSSGGWGEQNFQASSGGWGEEQNFQASNDGSQNVQPSNGEVAKENQNFQQSGWPEQQQNFRPSNGGWDDECQNFQPGNAEWTAKNQRFQPTSAEWVGEQQDIEPMNGEWTNNHQNFQPSNAEWVDEHQNYQTQNGKWEGKHDQNFQATDGGDWIDEPYNSAEMPKTTHDGAYWSDHLESEENPNLVVANEAECPEKSSYSGEVPKPVSNGGEWPVHLESDKILKPDAKEAECVNGSFNLEETPKPVSNGAEWSDHLESAEISKPDASEAECDRSFNLGEIPKPVNNGGKWPDNLKLEKNSKPYASEAECSDQFSNPEKIPKPVSNGVERSDHLELEEISKPVSIIAEQSVPSASEENQDANEDEADGTNPMQSPNQSTDKVALSDGKKQSY